jgi:hypothetical protein
LILFDVPVDFIGDMTSETVRKSAAYPLFIKDGAAPVFRAETLNDRLETFQLDSSNKTNFWKVKSRRERIASLLYHFVVGITT